MIIRTRVAGKALHLDPKENRALTGAQFRDGLLGLGMHGFDIRAIDHAPQSRIDRTERQRIGLPRRRGNSVGIVLDHDHHGQLALDGETHGLVEIALPGRRLARAGDDDAVLAIQLHAPGDATGGDELRAGRRGHAHDVQFARRIVRRHHPTAGDRIAPGEILQSQVPRRDAAPHAHPSIPVVRRQIIPLPQLCTEGAQPFVPAARHMEMSLALPVQAFLPHVGQPALQHHTQQVAALLFVEGRGCGFSHAVGGG